MATFKAAGGFPTLSGDVHQDVSRIRDILYALESELLYMFENIGIDNMNEAELNIFTNELAATILARATAARSIDSNAIYAALADVVTTVDAAITDIQRQIGELSRQLGLVDEAISDIESWRSSVATTKTVETSSTLTIPPNEDVEIVSMMLPAGRYFLLSSSDFVGDNIDTADLRVSLNSGGQPLVSVAYSGAIVECNYYLVLDAGNTVTLTAAHTGDNNLTCTKGSMSAVQIGGGTT